MDSESLYCGRCGKYTGPDTVELHECCLCRKAVLPPCPYDDCSARPGERHVHHVQGVEPANDGTETCANTDDTLPASGCDPFTPHGPKCEQCVANLRAERDALRRALEDERLRYGDMVIERDALGHAIGDYLTYRGQNAWAHMVAMHDDWKARYAR